MRRQLWRFLVVVVGVLAGLLVAPVVQSGPDKLITHLSWVHYACAFGLLMFGGLWVIDLVRWTPAVKAGPELPRGSGSLASDESVPRPQGRG